MFGAFPVIITHLRHAERGATAVEYGLMIALIALAIFGAVTAFGGHVVNLFNDADLTGALS
jgi:pilus assembly protein Flp/PilA